MKYEFTGETKLAEGNIVVRRIRYTNPDCARKYVLGGWIESEANLSQDDEAMVLGDAVVCGAACVRDHAIAEGYAVVRDSARVCGHATASGRVVIRKAACLSDNAFVYEDSLVSDDARVYGSARVAGTSLIHGQSAISGNATVFTSIVSGTAVVSGSAMLACAHVHDFARITQERHVLTIGSIGSRAGNVVTFYRTRAYGMNVCCGCWRGSLEEFVARVKQVHGDTIYAQEYLAAAELAKLRMRSWQP